MTPCFYTPYGVTGFGTLPLLAGLRPATMRTVCTGGSHDAVAGCGGFVPAAVCAGQRLAQVRLVLHDHQPPPVFSSRRCTADRLAVHGGGAQAVVARMAYLTLLATFSWLPFSGYL